LIVNFLEPADKNNPLQRSEAKNREWGNFWQPRMGTIKGRPNPAQIGGGFMKEFERRRSS
jgi:hypothetical protein